MNDNLLDHEYAKITCGREINANSQLLKLFSGKPITQITNSTLADVAKQLKVMSQDDQFLLFLEWDALRNALYQYMGKELQGYSDRYQLAAITHATDFVEIRQNILPLTAEPQQTSFDS